MNKEEHIIFLLGTKSVQMSLIRYTIITKESCLLKCSNFQLLSWQTSKSVIIPGQCALQNRRLEIFSLTSLTRHSLYTVRAQFSAPY